MRETIERFVTDFQARPLPPLTRRRVRLAGVAGKADVAVGMRRSGKTFLLLQRIGELLESGVPRERILYVNFEDERLLPLAAADLNEFPEALYRLHPEVRDATCYFFLDEVHVVPGWERFVRRLVEGGGAQVALTGSSARLLSREIATSLRGRSLTTEVLPFGFDEALRHAGVGLPARFPVAGRVRSVLEKQLRRYLEVGGFPEVQALPAETRVRVLQDYVHVAVFRDVVERHGVAHVGALQQLVRQLVAAPAASVSVHKLFLGLKSQGFRLGKDAVYEDLRHLEDAFLLFTTELDAESARVRMVNPRKCYLVDPGLAHAFSLRAGRNVGHLLENVVYLELRRRGYHLSYALTKNGREVDFVARRPGAPAELIQACADLSDPGTRTRELEALRDALREGRGSRATVVTLADEQSLTIERRRVRIVPAWRWLLEEAGGGGGAGPRPGAARA